MYSIYALCHALYRTAPNEILVTTTVPGSSFGRMFIAVCVSAGLEGQSSFLFFVLFFDDTACPGCRGVSLTSS